jgi:hypothetical protein
MSMEDKVKAAVLKVLESPFVLANLAEEDIGLASAIRIIAETAEKRAALGESERDALGAALFMFETYLEGTVDPGEEPFRFAKYMASTCLPVIELPDGRVIFNDIAAEILEEDDIRCFRRKHPMISTPRLSDAIPGNAGGTIGSIFSDAEWTRVAWRIFIEDYEGASQ